ncbi:MAG: hypothetical protein JST68_05420 [Bacteroidetes bacterium]|nr:hypothetical protein [Bacteroidota bacterium]
MKKILILSTAAVLFTGIAFAQTGKDSTAAASKVKAKKEKKMPKPCPGKTCEKEKS